MREAFHDSDLTDAEWALLSPTLIQVRLRGRPHILELRAIVDAIFYVLRSGCAWRMLPRDVPNWSSVYSHVRRWQLAGTWEASNATLRARCRLAYGRQASPSAGSFDSQSVRTTEQGGERGDDGAQKINGRKRHLIVDTQGLLPGVKVLPANTSDREGGKVLLTELVEQRPALKLQPFADGGYRGKWEGWVKTTPGFSV